ncbi:MAG: glycosyltransferase, partial [Ignavibacteria bacterium]|nr:glycosyltransferase [Ignavibacteria bacterium]
MSDKPEFISVIVAVKNEEKNIRQLLNCLKQQNYNQSFYEIIIVDDYSEDETLKILNQMSSQIPNLVVISNRDNPSGIRGKKSALSYAISNSKGEILLFTDADCRPEPFWISSISKNFTDDVAAVIGFSPFVSQKNFINKIIQYENLKSSFLLSSFFNLGIPYLS